MDAVGTVEGEGRELVRRSGLDPSSDLVEMRQLVHAAVADYDERSLHGGLPALADLGEATKSVLDAVAGFGPLQRYLEEPTIGSSARRSRGGAGGVFLGVVGERSQACAGLEWDCLRHLHR
jgi:hypothetical protein